MKVSGGVVTMVTRGPTGVEGDYHGNDRLPGRRAQGRGGGGVRLLNLHETHFIEITFALIQKWSGYSSISEYFPFFSQLY